MEDGKTDQTEIDHAALMGVIGELSGTIQRMHASFGFIRADGEKFDRFFIPSCVRTSSPHSFKQMAAGQRVRFTPVSYPKGPRAVEVRTIEGRV